MYLLTVSTVRIPNLKEHVRVVIGVLAEVKSGVVHDVALLHDVCTHGHVPPSSILTDGLQTDIEVWVCCSGEALKHTLLSKEQGADVNGEYRALLLGILLVKLDVFGEEVEGLGLVLENLEDALAARDDDDIKVLELVIGIVVVHVGLDGEALNRGHGGRRTNELAVKGLAGYTLSTTAQLGCTSTEDAHAR